MINLESRRRNRGPICVLLAVVVVLAVIPGTAGGYTISTTLTDGCHEQLTSAALRAVRTDLPTAAPLATTDNERALVDDLQFSPDGDMRDLGGATDRKSVG
jgi:hypothetical protein